MFRLSILTLFFILCSACCEDNIIRKRNVRPVIGIVSQKVTVKYTPKVRNSNTYIAASYVKFMEMAGAQVVPILPSFSKKRIIKIINSINGVVFPGGSAPLFPKDSGYATVSRLVFEKAKDMNDDGIHFPILGICLGFETLHALVVDKTRGIITPFNAENMPVSLNLTKNAFRSRLFDDFNMRLIRSILFEPITLNMHSMGVSPAAYIKNKKLRDFFTVLSTNTDFDGKEFVSTVEGIKYPFYGLQWHPEKNIYEWTRAEKISHLKNAVEMSQQIANFFVKEARKNDQRFDTDKEELENSIFTYAPVYSGGTSLFEQVYVFGNHTERLLH